MMADATATAPTSLLLASKKSAVGMTDCRHTPIIDSRPRQMMTPADILHRGEKGTAITDANTVGAVAAFAHAIDARRRHDTDGQSSARVASMSCPAAPHGAGRGWKQFRPSSSRSARHADAADDTPRLLRSPVHIRRAHFIGAIARFGISLDARAFTALTAAAAMTFTYTMRSRR